MSELPLVKEKTYAQSESIRTVIGKFEEKLIVIPDYQRDADQWGLKKESLFIESILNNLTIPAFFFAENENGIDEVVDGQQRLSTVLKYYNNQIKLSDEDGINYLTPQSSLYQGKTYSELPERLKKIFNAYTLTIINLPSSLDLSVKLEIFRRINEGGTPLTGQDIRLAYYSQSKSVIFIKLAGIHNLNPSANKIIQHGEQVGVQQPWIDEHQYWFDWWDGKIKSKGQTPSEMFLWYLVSLHREKIDSLTSNSNQMRHLPISFRGGSDETLDIYCAQLRYTDNEGGECIFPTYDQGLVEEFNLFKKWINIVLRQGLTGSSVDKYKQLALFIAACVELQLNTNNITHDQWDLIGAFIKSPRSIAADKLNITYPEPKGRWKGDKGQKAQCDIVVEIVKRIINEH